MMRLFTCRTSVQYHSCALHFFPSSSHHTVISRQQCDSCGQSHSFVALRHRARTDVAGAARLPSFLPSFLPREERREREEARRPVLGDIAEGSGSLHFHTHHAHAHKHIKKKSAYCRRRTVGGGEENSDNSARKEKTKNKKTRKPNKVLAVNNGGERGRRRW